MTDFGRRPDVPIKLIQRGRISVGALSQETIELITEVDLTKSILFSIGIDGDDSSDEYISGKIELTDSTHITASRTYTLGNWVFAYQVIEFKSGVKSVQRGTGTFGVSDELKEITITEVDTAKSILSYLGAGDEGSYYKQAAVTLELTNSTTITARRGASGDATTFGYEVLEFI